MMQQQQQQQQQFPMQNMGSPVANGRGGGGGRGSRGGGRGGGGRGRGRGGGAAGGGADGKRKMLQPPDGGVPNKMNPQMMQGGVKMENPDEMVNRCVSFLLF